MSPDETDPESAARSRLFESIRRRFDRDCQTPLTVVVCGPGQPEQSDPTDPFHLREAIKNSLAGNNDVAFYIEDWLKTDDGRQTTQQMEARLGHPPDLKDLEIEILESQVVDKDIHLLERPGAILELRDFEDSPVINKKLRVFINKNYRGKDSYVNTFVERLIRKGVKIFWYTTSQDLIDKVQKALVPNRIEKARRVRASTP